MTLMNTDTSYGTIAKWIHWTTALLFLAAYCTVYYRDWFTDENTPENWNVLQLHFSIGITLGVVVLLRIIWRITNTQPKQEPGTNLEHLAARLGHYALYAMMVIMPVTGYLGTGANTDFFFLFEIPKFEDTGAFSALIANGLGLSFEELERPLDFIHKDIGGDWVVWMLILGHMSAALYHHFVKKDRTLVKMTHLSHRL